MFFAIYQNTTVKKNWTLIISGYRPVEYLIIHNEQHYVPLLWQECIEKRGVFVGKACGPHGPYVPDVLFWSIVLFFSTVAMSAFLKDFKTSRYFPTKVEAPLIITIITLIIFISNSRSFKWWLQSEIHKDLCASAP